MDRGVLVVAGLLAVAEAAPMQVVLEVWGKEVEGEVHPPLLQAALHQPCASSSLRSSLLFSSPAVQCSKAVNVINHKPEYKFDYC